VSTRDLDEHIMDLQEINAGLVERLQAIRRILELHDQPGGPWGNSYYALREIREILR
jgi:hypothetical protein